MLTVLRRHSKSKAIKILLGAVALSFIIGFGAFGYVSRTMDRKNPQQNEQAWVARVNGQPIELAMLIKAERYYEDLYRRQLGDAADQLLGQMDLTGVALNELISERVMEIMAGHMGLTVTDQEVADAIYRQSYFQTNGRFDRDRYLNMLRRQRLTPAEYEGSIRSELLSGKLRNLVRSSVKVADSDVRDAFLERNDKVSFKFVKLNPDPTATPPVATDEQVRAYFDANQDKFKAPEKRKIRYVEFNVADYENQTPVTDAEIQAYYDENKDREFTEPEKVHARHILIRVAADADEATREAGRLKAQQLREQAAGGADFAELATKNSEDPGSAKNGGDLGWFPRGRMVKAFEDAAFALEPNAISDVIETQFGYHIIQTLEKAPAKELALDEVSDRIKATLTKKKAKDLATADAAALREKYSTGANLLDLGKEAGKKVGTSSAFAQNEPIPGLQQGWKIARQVFSMAQDEVSQPIDAGDAVYVVQLAEIVPPSVPAFAEVESRVKQELAKELERQALEKKAELLLTALKGGATLEKIAAENGLTVEDTGLFARNAASIPKVGMNPELLVAAFALTPEHPILPKPYTSGSGVVIGVLAEHQQPTDEEYAAQKSSIHDELVVTRAQVTLQAWLEQAEKTVNIERNEELLNALRDRRAQQKQAQN